MKRQILNLGRILNKTEQTVIKGGYSSPKECARYCDSCQAILVGGNIEFVCA